MKQLIDIGLTVSHANQHRVGAMPLGLGNAFKTVQPFGAFLLFNRKLCAFVFLAKLLAIPCPTLDIQQSQWRAFDAKGHRVMHDQSHRAILKLADRSQIFRRRMCGVIQTRRVLRAQDHRMFD